MGKKKGKKKDGNEPRNLPPGMSIQSDTPSTSRGQPPVNTGSTAAREPVSAPKSKQTEKDRNEPRHLPPGMSVQSDTPSTSRGQPPVSTGPTTAREPVTASAPKSKQTGPSDPAKSDVPSTSKIPADPTSSGEQRPTTSEPIEREVSSQFRELAISPIMPRKPAQPGKLGRPISLISNCYPLRFTGCYVYHYDIEIMKLGGNPSQAKDDKKYRCLNTRVNRKVFKKLCSDHFPRSMAVYDGEKNVYCTSKLPSSKVYEVKIEAENPGEPGDPRGLRMDKFEVYIKPVEKKETGDNVISLEPLNALFTGRSTSVPLDAVMVLETVLRYVPCLNFVPVGRSFYSPPEYKNPLGNGKEVWFGHHQSVRLAQKTPVVNLDISATAFYESISVVKYIERLLPGNIRLDQVAKLEKRQIEIINKDLRNITVKTTHSFGRKYKIDGLAGKSAREHGFQPDKDKAKVTVEKYYKDRYKVTLRYPHLPCLKVKNKDSLLPMEVCEIVKGQHSNKELNPKQQAEMIKYTSKYPQDRFEEINKTFKECQFNKDPYLQNFGLRVDDQPLRPNGRTMETPNVLYKGAGGEIRERPRMGTWNMMNKQFYIGTRIKKWTLLSFADKNECHSGKLGQFAGALHRYANEQGVVMDRCLNIKIADALLQNVRFCIKDMKEQFQAELIFVVLPIDGRNPGKHEKASLLIYNEVKRVAETDLGIVTQCVKGENVIRQGTNPSFISNLCLKMNAKMGGVNNSMVPAEVSMLPQEPILFVGADVNHPAPTENTNYSLAAVVGNLDFHPCRYAVAVRAQKNDKNVKKMVEVILNMKEMMKKLLIAYRSATSKIPNKIIIYRDGVSDGQFYDVQKREIQSIRDACTSLSPTYKPKITFIVVQKNHHVRFLPEQRRENPPPGTVIDSTVTHPLNFDFFLYSHKGLKGTSRPCYYTVLADDNNFGFDTLEKMTYGLCYTYVRCTKSISLPPPVQYADLAAYRARKHLNSHLNDMEIKGKIVKEQDGKFPIPIQDVQDIINVDDYMKDTMYYV